MVVASGLVRYASGEYAPGTPKMIDGSLSGAFRKMTFGLTAIGAAGTVYAQGFISHGLGTTPTCVVATSEDGEQYATVQTRDGSQFLCTSKKTNGATNSGVNVHWIAIVAG